MQYDYEEIKENAVVTEANYRPAQHGSGLGVGISVGSGNVVPSVVQIDIPENYLVVFESEGGGKTTIQGHDRDTRELWNRMHVGEKVTLHFRNIYGTDKLLNTPRKFIKKEFIIAWERKD